MKTARFVRWHTSLPTFGSEIALPARMSAPSFAGFPWCAFTWTKKVTVPAAILFRSTSMAAARYSCQVPPPTQPLNLHQSTSWLPSTTTDWHTNTALAPLSAFNKALAKTLPIQADLNWSPLPLVPLCTAIFSFFFSNNHMLLPFWLFCLNRHLPLLGPETHSLRVYICLCPLAVQ